MKDIQDISRTQPATSTQRRLVRAKSVGAASTTKTGRSASVKPTVEDRFETASRISSRSADTSSASAGKKTSTKRKVTVALVGATTGAAVLGFAGYGIYAAAPHIAAGITAAFAVPAVHFVAIGVGVGLAAALVGIGIYAAVKKYKAYKANRDFDDTFSVSESQARGPRKLSAENLAKQAAASQEILDDVAQWREKSPVKAQDPILPVSPLSTPDIEIQSPKPQSTTAQGLAEALFARQAEKEAQAAAAQQVKRNPPPPPPATKAAVTAAKPSTVQNTKKMLRFLSFDKSKVGADAAANWNNLDAKTGSNTKGWKDFYASLIIDYVGATSTAERNQYFQELHGELSRGDAMDLFPEAVDQETFTLALNKLEPLARAWNGRQAKA